MRRFLAGIVLLLLIPAAAGAQFKGEVESIGFDSYFRPNCFVPMLVRIQAQTSGTYQLQVVQEDLDRDLQIFAQTISLTGAEESRGAEQRFWMYFIPQPSERGLPDPADGLRPLQQRLKVFLCDEKGTKQLAQLPVTSTIRDIEKEQGRAFDAARGVRMILAVSDGPQPVWDQYRQTIGTMENVIFVPVRSTALPEDVRGYEMIDGIVWLAAPLPDPRRPSDEKRFKAIADYVRAGGHLVICQPAQREATATFAEMLPVNVLSVEPREDMEPLRSIARAPQAPGEAQDAEEPPQNADPPAQPTGRQTNRRDWALGPGPFLFARAEPKRGAIVVEQLNWNADGSDQSPYIARHGFGLGCVTWVAHDLSDPVITTRGRTGWPYVWDVVLGYRHDLTIVGDATPTEVQQLYSAASGVELSRTLMEQMRLTSKSRALISIAVVFFIAYWAVAGPGVYFYLLTRTRQQLSWFLFAFSAVAATMLTVLVVKLVVRGAPEMAHMTVVRGGMNMPQISVTRMGLYIPRDGLQDIELPDVAPRQVSYITADPRHPKQSAGDNEFPAQQRYFIPIHDVSEEGPVKITVPFRSTGKEFYTRRVGAAGGSIDGSARLREQDGQNILEGRFTNGTGNRLRNVYVVYHDPWLQQDVCIYLPTLEKSQTVDLRDLNPRDLKWLSTLQDEGPRFGRVSDNIRLYGFVGNPATFFGEARAWANFWYAGASPGMDVTNYGDLQRALPMMSVFGRLPPVRNGWKRTSTGRDSAGDRFDLLRRGGRYLDCSNVVAAGQLLVLAEADNDQGKQPLPLPFPLMVEGDEVKGKGMIYFQFALPLERIATPATQPANTTQPAVAAKVEK